MSKLTSSQKAERVLRLLLGIRDVRVSQALAGRGFCSEDLEQGWSKLRSLARGRLDALSSTPTGIEPSVLADLDRWQSRWFPVAEVILTRYHPELGRHVLLGLSPAEGPGIVSTLDTLVERLTTLFATTDEESRAAVRRLVGRGLTERELSQARAWVTAARTTQVPATVEAQSPGVHEEEHRRAERELWDWYLTWSRVARETITERSLLRSLGLGTRTKTGSHPTEDDSFELVTTTGSH
jgi:hypothetical protein